MLIKGNTDHYSWTYEHTAVNWVVIIWGGSFCPLDAKLLSKLMILICHWWENCAGQSPKQPQGIFSNVNVQTEQNLCVIITSYHLKNKSCHDAIFVFSGSIGGCHDANFVFNGSTGGCHNVMIPTLFSMVVLEVVKISWYQLCLQWQYWSLL